jgi:hypothetical protein
MIRARIFSTVITVLAGTALVLQGQAGGQEFKGQVKIGVHQVKLEAGKIYMLRVEGPKDNAVNVSADGLPTHTMVGKDGRQTKYCLPSRSADYIFRVTPGFFPGNAPATIDYVLKVEAMNVGDKPLLEDKSKWTDQDPTYRPTRDSHFKDYKIQLKANVLYVIDLVKGGDRVDPYLYLEGPDGKIVAQDDDSGGDLNARIFYVPNRDGEHRIIATTLFKATGDFTLTVREAK